MGDLVFELLTEEIPARFATEAKERFGELAEKKLSEASLHFSSLKAYITPRRLALHVQGINDTLPAHTKRIKGPRTSAPPEALQGFLDKTGLKKSDLIQEETSKGPFWSAMIHTPAQSSLDILPHLLQDLVYSFTWPTYMFWGHAHKAWIRPVRRVLFLWNDQTLPLTLDFDDPILISSNLTEGHRFRGRGPFTVTSWTQYVQTLTENSVLLCDQKRRTSIVDQIDALLNPQSLFVNPHDIEAGGLLDEVTHLVEWPAVYMGTLDKEVMTLPDSVIAVTIRHHQRCFPVYNAQGALEPFFLATANGTPGDHGKTFIKGVERVVRARLKDALFLYHQDRKIQLDQHADALKTRSFFQDLGTLHDKTERLQSLARALPTHTPCLITAAALAKADLATHMVQEFPELQGKMGAHYGAQEGLNQDICQAIEEQYATPHDKNLSPNGLVLGILDRIDSLYGFFSIGKRPTGSKDPLALKRMGNDLLRRLFMLKNTLNVKTLLDETRRLFQAQNIQTDPSKVIKDLNAFFQERLSFFFKNQGCDNALCLFLTQATLYDSLDLQSRIRYGSWVLTRAHTATFKHLAQAIKRVLNLVDKTALEDFDCCVDISLFQDLAENALFQATKTLKEALDAHKAGHDFEKIWTPLEALAPAIDNFFEAVMVNTEDIILKKNRICLLAKLARITNQLGLWQDV